ncbi:hypothetical protein B0D95_01045 [Cellvibrio sp. PSBB023]|nr:hypothetical protein B0D95_01045 [Cellvibrio sp. PSBB023]
MEFPPAWCTTKTEENLAGQIATVRVYALALKIQQPQPYVSAVSMIVLAVIVQLKMENCIILSAQIEPIS